jgi:hypothetical protein
MHCDSSSEVLRRDAYCNGNIRGNDYHKINANVNRRTQWRSRRQGSSRTARQKFSFMLTTYRLFFLLAVSYLLLDHQTCSGSEDAASSFQRPPPPPPGSSFSAPATVATNDYSGENIADDYYQKGQQQQGMSPPPPPPPSHENYNYSGETQQDPWRSDPSSSSPRGQQQQNPSFPIHYDFPITEDDNMNTKAEGGQRRRRDSNDDGSIVNDNDSDMPSTTSSARKDLVTRYWSTKTGKAQIQTVVGLVGYSSGSFVAKVRNGNT